MSIDKIAETNTSDEEICSWLKDKVRDSNGDSGWTTSEIYNDEEIVESVLNRASNSHQVQEEWLECPDDSNQETEELNPEIDRPSFESAMQSLDNVIDYLANDVAEVSNLKILRSKLIEREWRRRNV